MKVCENCGKEFEPVKATQRFCCPKCKDTYHNTRRTAHGIEKAGLEHQQPTKVYVDAEWVKTLQNQLTAANDRNTELLAMFQDYMGTSITAVDALIKKVCILIGEFQKKRTNYANGTSYTVLDNMGLNSSIFEVNNAIMEYNNRIMDTDLYQKYYTVIDDDDDEYEDAEEYEDDDEYEDGEEYDDTEDSGANW